MMVGGDTEIPLFLEHNLGDLDTSKVSKGYPLMLAPMQNVAIYVDAALRVYMLCETDYNLAMAERIADVDNFLKDLLQLLAVVS